MNRDTLKKSVTDDDRNESDANRDPISGAPGAHPVGTGVGAAAGGIAAAAAAGTLVGGPIGAAAGAVVGAVVGGLAGKAVAEHYDPTAEQAYWRDNYMQEPYYRNGTSFDEYWPAYNVGGEWRSQYPDRAWEDVEVDIERDYTQRRGTSQLEWQEARDAARAAWSRRSAENRRVP